MRTLFDAGLRHVLDGHSSPEELLRVADVPHAGAERRPDDSGPHRVMTRPAAPVAPVAPPPPDPESLLGDLELLEDGPASAQAEQPAKAMILLVEDEDTLRRVVRDLLEQEGYAVCEARDGSEALEQVDQHAPDLVLLDLNLPTVDGYTVLAQLRSRPATRDLPIIVLSARGDEENEVRVLRLGATDFLTKPFRPRALTARLETALGRRPA
jgi:CheY-like chemotaxis protein